MTKQEATFRAQLMLANQTYDSVAKFLGISKPTLYTRLVKKNWKIGEMALLERV
jgi:transcriptional regulator with PAS, ATPase and Fis domain